MGGIPVILVKGCLRRQEPCANFFNLRKNRTRSQELQEYKRAAKPDPPSVTSVTPFPMLFSQEDQELQEFRSYRI